MISIRETTWFTYEDANGDRRWIEGNDTTNTATGGEIFINSGNDHFRYTDANGNIRDVNIGQTASTGSKGEVYVTGKRWAWCPSDNTERSERGDLNDSGYVFGLTATVRETTSDQYTSLNWDVGESKDYLTQEYEVFRREGSTVDWSKLTTTGSLSYEDYSVDENQSYDYYIQEQVVLADGGASSSQSETVSVTTGSDPDPSLTVNVGANDTGTNTWSCTANVSGGTTPYNYDWYVDTSDVISTTWNPSSQVENPDLTISFVESGKNYEVVCDVTDDEGLTGSGSDFITTD